jgi:hypothetical protein
VPLQNRVTPFGDIIATPHRGLFTGNRGILHDPATRTLTGRRWTTPAWITCLCDFRGRKRAVMATRSWTELFFLDEAVAFAAGHRPCFYCRRADALRFRAAWQRGLTLPAPPRAPEIDRVLHAERLDHGRRRLHPLPGRARDLPDGSFVQAGGQSLLVAGGALRPWSPQGYGTAVAPPDDLRLLTPPSIVAAFAAGYRPVLHPSHAA